MQRIDYAGNANGSIEILDKRATDIIKRFFEENPEKAGLFGKNPFEMNNVSRYWIYEADAKQKSAGRLVVEEALNNGTPVMVSNRVGCAEEIVNENNGVVFTLHPDNFEQQLQKISDITTYNRMRQHIATMDFEAIEQYQVNCYL